MKKFKSKILSFVLSLCLIVALLPVNPAIAATTDSALDVTMYKTVSEIPTTFKGAVYTYNRSDDDITIDVGLYNLEGIASGDFTFRYDPSDVDLMWANGSGSKIEASGTKLASGHEAQVIAAENVDLSLYTTTMQNTLTQSNITKVAMFGDPYSPFGDLNIDVEVQDGALTGDIVVGMYATDIVNDGNFKHVTTEGEFPSAPANTVMPVYSYSFKVKEGAIIDKNTFRVFESYAYEAPGFLGLNSSIDAVESSVAFVGFPEVTYYPVNFVGVTATDENGDTAALSGATVTIKDADGNVVDTGTTDDDGNATLYAPAGENYSYVISKEGYNDLTSTTKFAVTTTGTDDITPAALTKKASVYTITWKFTDAEGAGLEGVKIEVTSLAKATNTTYTKSDGTATMDLEAGSYSYTASLEGYVSVTNNSFTVEGPMELAAVAMQLDEATKYEYRIKVADNTSGNVLSGARVVVYDKSGTTKIAEEETDENGIATFSLVAGEYTYIVTKGLQYEGITTKTPFIVYDDPSKNTTEVELIPEDPLTLPYYEVTGSEASDGRYKVDVTLNNIRAIGASFGLKYDSKIFTLITDDGVADEDDAYEPKYNADIEVTKPAAENLDAGFAPQQSEEGYVTFGWHAGPNTEAYIDATDTENPPLIVTYYFEINEDLLVEEEWKNWIHSKTFEVMPWTDTEQGAKDDKEVADDIWSADEHKYMGLALVDDEDDNLLDIPTAIDMVFIYQDNDRYLLTFKVTEADSDPVVNIAGATINLYDAEAAEETNLGPITTDGNGVAEIVVGAGTYEYIAMADNYWSQPESELREEYISTGEITAPTTIEVELRKMVYRDVTANVLNGTIISEGSIPSGRQTVTDENPGDTEVATATWPNHATDGVNLLFAPTPAAGYELDGTPQYAIGENPAEDAFKDASFDKATNQWYVPGGEINDKVTISAKFKTSSFTITANMSEGGKLTWAEVEQTSVPVSKEFAAGANSGLLVFDADNTDADEANHYEIYQVVIDGSEYPFEDKDKFEYEFESITDDHTITVIYRLKTPVPDPPVPPGPEPPVDPDPEYYTVSVHAGDYGSIRVTYGEGEDAVDETVVGNGARDFVVPWDVNFYATATPTEGYEIDSLVVNSEERTITDRTSQTVELTNSKNAQSVIATFRQPGGPSIQYWVKTEIVGKGKALPFGVKFYYAYETPTYTFGPETLWRTESITFNGVDKTAEIIKEGEEPKDEYEYTFPELTENVTIVATYVEIIQPMYGVVNYARGTREEQGNIDAQTLPTVTFVRDSDGKIFEADVSDASTYAFLTGETNSTFTIDLPDGVYTITASKNGHLDYVITGFEVDIAETVKEDIEEPEAVEGVIALTPGNTNTDKHITFFDILRVVNGMVRYGDGSADIDETGIIGVEDMNFAKANYAEKAVDITYATHKTEADPIE